MKNDALFPVEGFSYDPTTGAIFKDGVRRDYSDPGYRRVFARGVRVVAHRLAWRLMVGSWPVGEVDHRDRNKQNNRFSNLRQASESQNRCNISKNRKNTSGERCVVFDSNANRWRVLVGGAEKRFQGYASTKQSAILAARLIRRTLHGEFYCHESTQSKGAK